jgi:hypothetical protein
MHFRTLGEDMVVIDAGTNSFTMETKQRFHIHKGLICQKSDFFNKLFNGGFKEAVTQSATLPEEHPKVFGIFVSWLYRDEIDKTITHDPLGPAILAELYFMAEKYVLPRLMDNTMDMIVEALKTQKQWPGPLTWTKVYDRTKEGSKLRLLMARTCVWVIVSYPDDDPNWASEEIHATLSSCPEMLMDVIRSK